MDRTTLSRKAVRLGAAMLALGAVAAPVTAAWAKGGTSAMLDQCANGPTSAPVSCASAKHWVNGDLGPTKSHYAEGDSVPYRVVIGGLTPGADVHTVTIQWDTTKSGKHALDYLTSYDRTQFSDPCAGVKGCGSPSMLLIPLDPRAINQAGGSFTIFGGSFTGVTNYTPSGSASGDSSESVTLSFTASAASPVIAWGGHIASQADWGTGNSAANISGSPYHMYLLGLDGTGGRQDRALKVEASTTNPNPTPSPTPVVTPTPTVTPTPGSTPNPGSTPPPSPSQTPAPGSTTAPSANGIVSVLGEQVTRPAPAAAVTSDQAPTEAAAQPSAAAAGSATELPMTGANSGPLAVAGLLLIAVGATLRFFGRRQAAE